MHRASRLEHESTQRYCLLGNNYTNKLKLELKLALPEDRDLIYKNIQESTVHLKGMGDVECFKYHYIASEKSIFNYNRLNLAMQSN